MVEVQRLAVEVARGFADLEELFDLGVRDVEVAGGRAAAQRALRNREGQRIHDADERDDAAGLAVEADWLADAAHASPISADSAALRGQPDILVPGADDALEAVADAVQIAADRQAAAGAAVGQNRSRGHEPQFGDVIIDALRMFGVVGIGRGDAGEEVLVILAREQIAVAQRVLAEFGQERVAAVVGDDREGARVDSLAVAHRRGGTIVGRDVRSGRKIHVTSPFLATLLEDRMFFVRSTRCHARHPSLFGPREGENSPPACGNRGRASPSPEYSDSGAEHQVLSVSPPALLSIVPQPPRDASGELRVNRFFPVDERGPKISGIRPNSRSCAREARAA